MASSFAFKKGSKGINVKLIQQWLLDHGFDLGRWGVDGDFGSMTTKAVKAYQKAVKIKVDGVVGPVTVACMGLQGLMIGELVDWFSGGNVLIPKNVPYEIIDVWTGTRITVIRTSGSYHADVEPATAADGAKYKSLWGQRSWSRRPILVCINGRYIAASTHCMPHAGREDKPAWAIVSSRSAGYGTGTNYDSIKGNGAEGHICNHLYRSKGHASGKMDAQHQKCVMIAAGRAS